MNAARAAAPRAGNIYIAGCGSHLPRRRVGNAEVERDSGYDAAAKGASLDAWALRHHGGCERYWAAEGEATSDLMVPAARRALEDAGLAAAEIELIVLATFTSDHPVPPTAARVQARLGSTAKFVQIDAACTGFIDAMWVACSLMRQHGLGNALVLAGDILSRLSHPSEFLPRTVFGDAAGAAVLAWQDDPQMGVFAFSTGSDGQLADHVLVPAGGSRQPLTPQAHAAGEHFWRLRFHEIRPWALERLTHCTREVLGKTGLACEEVDWFIPHQASTAIIREAGALLGIPPQRTVVTYDRVGNTSGASIPVALDFARREQPFRRGDWMVMAAVGAGMAWGALSYRWPGIGGPAALEGAP
jgi:3-oxoacyl-[acyl-carrier-protein] synthase-3